MLNMRGLVVVTILAVAALGIAQSRATSIRHRGVDCDAIRKVVAMVGAAEAEKLARAGGVSDTQIAAAKRCLK